jgi:nitrate/TMAO reductase-like tetraheme cytochrome c subunit
MAKISLAGFTDPVRRPRYIIWTLVVVLIFAAFMVTVLGITSTRWFCSQGCHKVQDDTIVAYEHSTHSQISCMACHMPVNANPIIFLIHKAEALGELAQTVTNNYELPLNAESEVALTMKSIQCTQCHNMDNRKVTPDPGLKINHAVHRDKAIDCTICHNRIAHNEDFPLTLKNPKTGELNQKHANFMTMTACFRCHGQEQGAPAPGTCSACHTPGFELKPASHNAPDFFPAGHAKLADEAKAEVAKTLKETGQSAVTGERKAEFEAASRQNGAKNKETVGQIIPPVGAIFECGTCHKDQFCTDCHGMTMPHPDEFKKPKNANDPAGHPVISQQIPAKCVQCHLSVDPNFCDKCHHGTDIKYTYNPAEPWVTQHPKAVAKVGIKPCTSCHTSAFCSDCHTKNQVVPASHRQPGWLKPPVPTMTQYGSQPATASALHSLAAEESTETCAVCHGEGGFNAPFCANCHKLQMPHNDEFKKFHSTTGAKNPAVCSNCHIWPELCSNCHHVGASTTQPWLQVHGGQVEKTGAAGCIKQCHKATDCQACHRASNVQPASHRAPNFLKAPGKEIGMHAQLYQKDSTVCTYCHSGDPANLPNSPFCSGCHKLPMPHPDGFGLKDPQAPASKANAGTHAALLASGKTPRTVCANCHAPDFCNSCHHKDSVATTPWLAYHPNVVKKSGATPCFDCHDETYCSNCHVNSAARGLLK